jgi:hypothetical protein
MKNLVKGTMMAVAAAMFFAACSKDDNGGTTVQPLTVKTANDIIADTIIGFSNIGQPVGAGKYTFYSLENNSVVPSSDSNSTKWDLAFRGTTIITNSGVSGPGNGGAFVFVGTFEDLKTIPSDSAFRTDVATNNLAIPTGSNRGWYIYNAPANLVTPIPGRVIVVRTATGKYAKLEIQNYYKGGTTPDASASDDIKIRNQRYYKFRYIYQPNGSKSFE